jgi:hypothetical protein
MAQIGAVALTYLLSSSFSSEGACRERRHAAGVLRDGSGLRGKVFRFGKPARPAPPVPFKHSRAASICASVHRDFAPTFLLARWFAWQTQAARVLPARYSFCDMRLHWSSTADRVRSIGFQI